ncbi:uncharacterized protein LDX57_007191 [Aspergillus melleus]|uniref:uncharacterized protein n=1 Tax=Aspergillus melleus TaxID=138277 RepID=UPI001E8CB238|nr:uncharacterized protein LDX57_007191 [Aspergillus melleus]KAH8429529.1 hypothetical protein LDX57_007191 [Aspergillus melleus]
MAEHNGTETNGTKTNGIGSHTVLDGRIAISPNAPQDVPRLLKEVNALSQDLNKGNQEARLKLIDAAQSVVRALETPRETLLRYCWANSTAFAAIETCIDLGIFPILAQSDRSRSVTELAKATGAEPELLGRLLKHLGAMGVVVETGFDEYRRNGFSTALAMPRYSDAIPCINGCTIPSIYALPGWLKNNNYTSPNEGKNSPFSLGFKTDLHFFEFLSANPEYPHLAGQFNNLMSAYHQGRPSWMDVGFYPVQDNLIQGARTGTDEVFLVDVGGNKGHDIEEFKTKWPEVPGRLILQDQPHVLAEIKSLNLAIEVTPHDFFKEQPVKGARTYFLHSILHDWNDETCQKILRRLADAMTPGYSKLLINENVIPDTGAHWQATSLDIIMMVDLAAKERTEHQWYELIEPTGLKIVKIWSAQASAESLIECELA